MAKFYSAIGYAEQVETNPGVWKDVITERNYTIDITRLTGGWSAKSQGTNDDLTINNQFSIIADPFAIQNFHSMKYIVYMGTKWKITNVEVQYPRLNLTVGGVYNG